MTSMRAQHKRYTPRENLVDALLEATYYPAYNAVTGAWDALPPVRRRTEELFRDRQESVLFGRDMERHALGLEPMHSEWGVALFSAEQKPRDHLRAV